MVIRPLRIALGAAVALALVAVVGFLVAPPFVRSQITGNLAKTLTTKPTLARVRLNPFVMSMTLEKLRVPDTQGRTAVGFERLYLRFDPLRSLFARGWTLAELQLDGPTLNAEILPDRTLNLTALVRPQPPAKAAPDSVPPAFFVRHFQIRDGALHFADRSRAPALEKQLAPIRFELNDFGTRRDSPNAYSFNARSEAGEALAWRGRFQVQPFRSEGDLEVQNLRAATLVDLMGPQTPFVLARGTFGFQSRYTIDATRTPAEILLRGLKLSMSDVAMVDRESGEEVVAARALTTEQGTLDLVHGTLDLGAVKGGDARVLVWMQPDGHINFERWAKPTPGDTAKPLLTTIPSAHVDGLALEFQDRRLTPAASIHVRGNSVDLEKFSTAPGSEFHLAAACSLGVNGHGTVQGMVTPGTPSATLDLDLHGFELRDIQPYISAFARLEITQGTADGTGKLLFNTFGAKGPLLRFNGVAASHGFNAIDRKSGEKFLAWKQLELKGLDYDMLPGRMGLREVVATQPYVRMVVTPDRLSNVAALQVPPDSIPLAFRPPPGQVDTMPVRIDLVKVVDGSAYFADFSLTPRFGTGIQSLNGTIKELSSAQAAHADMHLEGKVDAYAPALISGTINPLNGRGRTDVQVSFKNIELTTFTPYSGKFMGYRIARGKLDLDLNYAIQDGKLDAKNKVFMRQLTLGEKVDSPDATHLPVRFAIALLKDREGNIDLNLPVKGDLNDPKFSVFPIIMKVLIGLVTKAVASPFALLGAVFGGGDEATPAIGFAYGSADLDSSAANVLAAVRKGLIDKPALRLEILEPGSAAGDSLALFTRRYAALLRATPPAKSAPSAAQIEAGRTLAPPGFDAADWVARVTQAYVTAFGKVPPLEGKQAKPKKGAPPDDAAIAAEAKRLRAMDDRVRAKVAIDPVELAALPRERARRVQGFMLADTTIAPERVFITNAAGGAPAPADSGGVKVALTLTD